MHGAFNDAGVTHLSHPIGSWRALMAGPGLQARAASLVSPSEELGVYAQEQKQNP